MGRKEVSFAPWSGIPDCSTCSLVGGAGVMSTSEGAGTAPATGDRESPVVSGTGTAGAGAEEVVTGGKIGADGELGREAAGARRVKRKGEEP